MSSAPASMRGQPWADLSSWLRLSDARIVATLKDGGAVVETGLKILVQEGRRPTWTGTIDGDVCELEYVWEFELDAHESVQARIVIEGIHENGKRVEVRGDGWIGFDDKSRITGHFYNPPRVLLDLEDMDDEPGDETADTPVNDFVPADAKPSPQFERALYGRSLEEHHGVPVD